MSSSKHASPDQSGRSHSGANAPWVIVRAGKTFLCSACGTMVEIPDDVVGQVVVAFGHVPQDEPADEEPIHQEPPQEEAPSENPPVRSSCHLHASNDQTARSSAAQPKRTSSLGVSETPRDSRPNKPPRPKRPPRRTFSGQRIDGLIVPTSAQFDRALAWISFHRQVLKRQGAEVRRLQQLLKKQQAGRSTGSPEAVSNSGAGQSHEPTFANAAPEADSMHKRGPP